MSITNGQVLVATGFSTSDSADAPTVRGLIGVGTIAPWSASNAYALLDCASNGGVIYQCILARSATATVPASDGTHWTALTASSGGGPASKGRVRLSSGSSGTITDAAITSSSVIQITMESVGSLNGNLSLDGAPVTGSFNVICVGQDDPPYVHYTVWN